MDWLNLILQARQLIQLWMDNKDILLAWCRGHLKPKVEMQIHLLIASEDFVAHIPNKYFNYQSFQLPKNQASTESRFEIFFCEQCQNFTAQRATVLPTGRRTFLSLELSSQFILRSMPVSSFVFKKTYFGNFSRYYIIRQVLFQQDISALWIHS